MIKNCLGLTLIELKNDLMLNLENFSFKRILKLDCGGGGAGEIALANFSAFNAFVAKDTLDYLDQADDNNDRLIGDSPFDYVDKNFQSFLLDFAEKECFKGNEDFKQITPNPNLRNLDGVFPASADDETKEKLLQFLDEKAMMASATNGVNPTLDNFSPYIIGTLPLTDSSGLSDLTSSLFGDGVLKLVDMKKLQALKPDKIIRAKCFSKIFILSNYLVPYDDKDLALVTDFKIQNLKKIHNNILLPIYKYYFGDEPDSTCRMRIMGGLTSMMTAIKYLGASTGTRHVYGDTVNFSLVGVSTDQIAKDIASKKINIEFGAMALVNGVYITLPYIYENSEVRGIIMESPKFDSDDIRIMRA